MGDDRRGVNDDQPINGVDRREQNQEPRFTLDDVHDDLAEGTRRREEAEASSRTRTRLPMQGSGDPVRAAYGIVLVAALLTGLSATLILHLAGNAFVQGTARWAAPFAGTIVFAVLGVFLARSSVAGPR